MESKIALDKIIKKSRVHFYKPIQIAEILFYSRQKKLDALDLESYRNSSKKWRDQISQRLIGRICTSSQKFQDNIFDNNAMPPNLLKELSDFNSRHNGLAEAYIYKSLENKLNLVHESMAYINDTSIENFSLDKLLSFFVHNPGLKRSIDKMYEIIVYALFSSLVRALQVTITLEINNKDTEVLKDFEVFIKSVLGLSLSEQKKTKPAYLYRVGVTNAADRGLDMLTNFGPVVQVKHLTLTEELVEDIVDGIMSDSIVIVCLDAEKNSIKNILAQIGFMGRIQGIVTLEELKKWYLLCQSGKYRNKLGASLINDLKREFEHEFPSSSEISPFITERGYDKITLPEEWKNSD